MLFSLYPFGSGNNCREESLEECLVLLLTFQIFRVACGSIFLTFHATATVKRSEKEFNGRSFPITG